MEGITILSTNSEMIWTEGTALLMFSLLGVALIIAVVMSCINAPIVAEVTAIVVCIICLLSAFLVMAFGPKELRITHKVLIDESVSMIEFNQKYKITDQEGQIYTIIEKDFSK